MRIIGLVLAIFMAVTNASWATPTPHVWIPSTDAQPFKTLHLTIDNFFPVRPEATGGYKPSTLILGPTVGLSPFKNVQAEAGLDVVKNGTALDAYPVYFNFKLSTPEGLLGSYSPALAAGAYGLGTRSDKTNQNVFYGLAAKTVAIVGRFTAGYYVGNSRVLIDETGAKANRGVLLAWDRKMVEISDRLWAAIDYKGGEIGVRSSQHRRRVEIFSEDERPFGVRLLQ